MKKAFGKGVGLETSKLKDLAQVKMFSDEMGFNTSNVTFSWGSPQERADLVNHPPHYNKGIETTQYIKSWGMNWNQSNVIKYVSRYNLKSSNLKLQIQDLKKAQWYLNDLINDLENNDS
jgi:hypothetical protein